MGNSDSAPPPPLSQGDTSHLRELDALSGFQIKEKANLLEAASAIIGTEVEMPNKYKVFDQNGQRQVFYAIEKTDCCTRQMKTCLSDCSPWNVDILYTPPGGAPQKAYEIKRPFTCTCCCFNRPKADVFDVRDGTLVGSLTDPCACCGLDFDIRDGAGNPSIKVNGGCCQWGLCCPLPCGPCSTVHFDIKDANGGDVGDIKKKVPSCFKFLLAPDVDNYHVNFPGVKDASQKVMLMAMGIFIDFRFFSDNSNDDNGGLMGDQGFGGDGGFGQE